MVSHSLNHEVLATDITAQLQAHKNFLDDVLRDDALLDGSQSRLVVSETGILPDVEVDSKVAIAPQTSQHIVVDYRLRSHRTSPVVIRHFEQYFTDYEKQKHVSTEQAIQLKESVAARALYDWALGCGTGARRLTSGSTRTASYGTGNRKALTFNDLLGVKKQLVRDSGHLGEGEWIGIVNANMYGDLMGLSQVQNGHYMVDAHEEGKSALRFLGITFYLREDLPAYAVSGANTTLSTYGSSVLNNHCAGALFFHKRLLRAAISQIVNVYADVSATYGGLTLSSEIKAGASCVRTDGKGLVILVENTA